MKIRLLGEFRGRMAGMQRTMHERNENGLGDIYVVHLVEKLNYCRNHPNSSKCQ